MSESATDRWKWLLEVLPSVEYWQRFCHQRNEEFLNVRAGVTATKDLEITRLKALLEEKESELVDTKNFAAEVDKALAEADSVLDPAYCSRGEIDSQVHLRVLAAAYREALVAKNDIHLELLKLKAATCTPNADLIIALDRAERAENDQAKCQQEYEALGLRLVETMKERDSLRERLAIWEDAGTVGTEILNGSRKVIANLKEKLRKAERVIAAADKFYRLSTEGWGGIVMSDAREALVKGLRDWDGAGKK